MIGIYASLVFLVGIWATLLSFSNRREMERLKKGPPLQQRPLVSILIPARNEEHFIQGCISSLTDQSYQNIEILILDDNSSDRTGEIAAKLQAQDPRVRIIKGKPLCEGWRGKLYAMQQLYEQSKGEYLLYTDADTLHNTNSVEYGMRIILNEQASFLSGYPKQKGEGICTQTLVSAMLFNTVLYIPLKLQKTLQWPPFAMAIGQYLLLKRTLLDDIEGFTSMKDVICDDVMLARACARVGHKQVFADMKDALSCRMFSSFPTGFQGLERSIIGVIDIKAYMVPLILVAATILIACAIAPISAIVMALELLLYPGLSPLPFLLTLGGSLLLFGSWTVTGLYHGFPLRVAIQGPMAFIFVVAMYLHGFYRKATGKGFIWKGRIIR